VLSNHSSPRVTAKTTSPSVDQEISRANVLLERGQTASARQLLDQLSRQPGARPRALVASANLEWHQGNYDDAIRIASQASHAGAGVEAISVRAFAELDARLYEQAVRDFKHVLELNPGDTDARDALGAAERQLRKTDR
jgi:tetratricopeptide (TPR) repeat protein